MKILGIRTSSTSIRYALLKKDEEGNIYFLNNDTENCLLYPRSLTSIGDKLNWVRLEIDRIINQNKDLDKIVIKINEYTFNDSKSKRENSYVDGIVIETGSEHSIPVELKLYNQISACSKDALRLAETRVGKTTTKWNKTIADAILAAYWEIK